MSRLPDLKRWNSRIETEMGQTMTEYAIVLGVITVTCVAVFGVLAISVADLVNGVVGLLP
jgi:Flp pilus assembly pilin Flp